MSAGYSSMSRVLLLVLARRDDSHFAVNSLLTCIGERFAARRSGLASGLALAVRPAGLAEAPGSRVCPKGRDRGSALDAGGASPDNARRTGSGPCNRSRRLGALARRYGLAVVLAGAAAGYGGDRRRPVTGAAVRGSRRAVGLASEGRGKAAAPQRRDPRVNPSRLRRVTLAAHSLSIAPPVLTVHGLGRQARRAEGAPLKIAAEKVVTGNICTPALGCLIVQRRRFHRPLPFRPGDEQPLPARPL